MIWLKFGESFRCSNCYTMPDFVDIRYIKVCPKCHCRADGFETILGILSMNNGDGHIKNGDH